MYFTPGCTAAYGGPFGCSGFYGQFMQAFGENASNAANSQDGNYTGVRAGWAGGAFNVSAALGTTRLASGNVSARNLGASWNLGSTQLMAQIFNDKAAAPTVPGSSSGWLIGAKTSFSNVQIPISFTTIRTNTVGSPSAGKFSVGYIYNLSKRTALYTTYSTLSNKNGAAAGGGGVPAVANASWTGIDFGLRHHF
jgi:predicted porin